jgi:hypothetical protein
VRGGREDTICKWRGKCKYCLQHSDHESDARMRAAQQRALHAPEGAMAERHGRSVCPCLRHRCRRRFPASWKAGAGAIYRDLRTEGCFERGTECRRNRPLLIIPSQSSPRSKQELRCCHYFSPSVIKKAFERQTGMDEEGQSDGVSGRG